MKIKQEGGKYYAYADYRSEWIPFAKFEPTSKAFGTLDEEIEISDDKAYIANCGPQCTGGYPDKNCLNCGGLGVLAIFHWRYSHELESK